MEEILQGSEEDSYFFPRCLETFAKSFLFDSCMGSSTSELK